MSIKDGGAEEKRQRAEAAQLKASDGQDYAVNEMGEGDRVLGLTTEYSGWDVYNNEARKVDRELVKDWTASLNFLLLFVSANWHTLYLTLTLVGCYLRGRFDRIHHRKQADA